MHPRSPPFLISSVSLLSITLPLLSHTERVEDVVLTDGLGVPLEGRTVGPLREGGSLDLACQANHGKQRCPLCRQVWTGEGGHDAGKAEGNIGVRGGRKGESGVVVDGTET